MKYPVAVLSLITGPVRVEYAHNGDGRNIITHLQKHSYFGFMLTWPFCFHFWLGWRLQEGSDEVGWKPGTEGVFYFRTPGWRYDAELGYKWTNGYFPSGHWD